MPLHNPDLTADTSADPTALPSPRAKTARHAVLGALVMGILADILLRNGPWGVGLPLWLLGLGITILLLLQIDQRRITAESGTWLVVAIVAGAGLAWRDADLLQFFDVLAMLTGLGLFAMSVNGVPVTGLALARIRDLVFTALGTAVEVAFGVVPLTLVDTELNTVVRRSDQGNFRRIIRALVIAAPIIVVFTLLLTQADPIFGSLVTIPELDYELIFTHCFVTGFFGWVAAGWLRRVLLSRQGRTTPASPLPFNLGYTDVSLVLGALNLLFAAFVIVQIRWLFGGEALVLKTTGLSYAEYARHGFFELTWVAFLLQAVLLGSRALIQEGDSRTLASYRRLSIPLVLLLGAIIFSAVARMRLYILYYGVSSDRLYATAFMIWIAVVFLWFAVTILRSRPRIFALGVVVSGLLTLFTLNCLNPDALVARVNLARVTTGRTGVTGADVRYLASLGGDAVPALVADLTSAGLPGDSTAAANRCAAAQTLLNRWTGSWADERNGRWTQWNLGRSRATEAIRTQEAALRRLACPLTPVTATP